MPKASPAKLQPSAETQELMRAVENGDAGRVRDLLAAGADVNAVSDGGKTALIRAATRGYLDIVHLLLDAGADVNAKKENGATALIVAVFLGYADIVRALLAAGADPSARTAQGTTAEKWAHSIGFTEIVELLRNADAIRAQSLASAVAATTTPHHEAFMVNEQVAAVERFDARERNISLEPTPASQQHVSFEPTPASEQNVAVLQMAASQRSLSVVPGAASEEAGATELFPAQGAFRPVVPLSEIDEPPASSEQSAHASEQSSHAPSLDATPDGLALHAGAVAGEEPFIEAHEAADGEAVRLPQTEPDEATLVPAHARLSLPRAAVAARASNSLRSWRVIVPVLALLLVGGILLDAQWKNSKRSPRDGQPASSSTQQSAPSSAQAETMSAPSQQSAPLVPDAPASEAPPLLPVVASDASPSSQASADRPANTHASSTPRVAVATEADEVSTPARRASKADERAARASSATPVEKIVNAEPVRRQTRALRRTARADAPVQRATSPDTSLPVFSPKPPAKSEAEKKRVIQWP